MEGLTPHLTRRQYIRGYMNALKQEQRNIDFNYDANNNFAKNGETLGVALDESETLLGVPKATLLPQTALKYRKFVRDPTTALKSLSLEELAFAAAGADQLKEIMTATAQVPMETMLFPGFIRDELSAAKGLKGIEPFTPSVIPQAGQEDTAPAALTGSDQTPVGPIEKPPQTDAKGNLQEVGDPDDQLYHDADEEDDPDETPVWSPDRYINITEERGNALREHARQENPYDQDFDLRQFFGTAHVAEQKRLKAERERGKVGFDVEDPYVGDIFADDAAEQYKQQRGKVQRIVDAIETRTANQNRNVEYDFGKDPMDPSQTKVKKTHNSHNLLNGIGKHIHSAKDTNLAPLDEALKIIKNPDIKNQMTKEHHKIANGLHEEKHHELALQNADRIREPKMAGPVSRYNNDTHYEHMRRDQVDSAENAIANRVETLKKFEKLREAESVRVPYSPSSEELEAKKMSEPTLFEGLASLLGWDGKGEGLPKSVRRQVGSRMKLRRNPVMHGRGLYYPVGDKHYINFKQLMNEGTVNIKDHRFRSCKGFGKSVVGGNVASAVKSVLQGEKPDIQDIEPLNDTERDYLNQLGKVTGEGKFNVPLKEKSKGEKLRQEFEILKGQIIAGNDNADLIKKFKKVCLQAVSAKALPKNKVQDVLIDLAALGY